MITTRIPYLSGEFHVIEEEPTTVQEISSLVGEIEVVKRFVKHFRYHYKYPRVYAEVARKIETLFKREDKETDVDYLERFLKENPEYARKMLTTLFDEVAVKEPLIPRGERGGPGKVSQGAMDAATGYFAKGTQEELAKSIEDVLIGYEIERDGEKNITVEGLARGIQKLTRHFQQQAKEKAKVILS